MPGPYCNKYDNSPRNAGQSLKPNATSFTSPPQQQQSTSRRHTYGLSPSYGMPNFPPHPMDHSEHMNSFLKEAVEKLLQVSGQEIRRDENMNLSVTETTQDDGQMSDAAVDEEIEKLFYSAPQNFQGFRFEGLPRFEAQIRGRSTPVNAAVSTFANDDIRDYVDSPSENMPSTSSNVSNNRPLGLADLLGERPVRNCNKKSRPG